MTQLDLGGGVGFGWIQKGTQKDLLVNGLSSHPTDVSQLAFHAYADFFPVSNLGLEAEVGQLSTQTNATSVIAFRQQNFALTALTRIFLFTFDAMATGGVTKVSVALWGGGGASYSLFSYADDLKRLSPSEFRFYPILPDLGWKAQGGFTLYGANFTYVGGYGEYVWNHHSIPLTNYDLTAEQLHFGFRMGLGL